MSKSFKKVIACILAVLMVTFSVPFSALAAAGDYTPNITLRFGTFHGGNAKDVDSWVDPNINATNLANATKVSSVFDTPVTLTKDGSLVLEATKMQNTYAASSRKYKNGATFSQQDYTYGVGEVFTVTVKIEDVTKINTLDEYIRYSDNIEPAGVVSFTNWDYDTVFAYATASEFADMESAFPDDYNTDEDDAAWYTFEAGVPIEAFSCTGLGDANKNQYLNRANGTNIDGSSAANGILNARVVSDLPTGTTAAAAGSYSGNICDDNGNVGTAKNPVSVNGIYLETFLFKIVDDGPITFEQAVTNDINQGYYIADSTDGIDPSDYTTYAINTYGVAGATSSSDENIPEDQRNAGSTKMNFMGTNVNNSSEPEECTHQNKTKTDQVNPTCTTDGTEAYWTCNDCGKMFSDEDCTTEITEPVTIPSPGHQYQAVVTAPTCTEGGFTTYTCSVCQDTYTADYTDPTGHTLNPVAEVPATCTTAGTAAYWECTVCHKLFSDAEGHNEIEEPAVIPALQHEYVISSIDWDTLNTTTGEVTANYVCSRDASHTTTDTVQTTFEVTQQQTETLPEITTYTYSVGEFNDSKEVQTKAPAGHTHNLTPYAKVPATCTEDGSEAYWVCSGCGKMFSDAEATNEISNPIVIPATGHKYVPVSVDWDSLNTTTKFVDVNYECEHDATHTNVTAVLADAEVVQQQTEALPELTKFTVTIGTFTDTKTVETKAALGITVTVPKYSVGEVTINGEELDGTKVNATNVAYGSTYTLAVTDGKDYFKGWEMNNKIVSEEETFSSVAYADITVTPVFEVPSANNITVVFYDKFGNKVKEYKDMSADDYQAAIAADGIPAAQSFPSATFVKWDTDNDTILGLTESKTIWAEYEDVESVEKYNVKVEDAAGADITDDCITLPAGVTKDAVPYDTQVTVQNDNAKGWAVNGVTVSTNETYKFYVGADITLTMLTDVEAEPTVTIIGANRLADPAYRYNIVATRNVPNGWTLVDYGFVYGKNLTDTELNINNEGVQGTQPGAGVVKVARAATKNSSSNEFALNYGVKAAGNYVTVKAFMVVKKGTDVRVIYSAMGSYDS